MARLTSLTWSMLWISLRVSVDVGDELARRGSMTVARGVAGGTDLAHSDQDDDC
jgi:hypothetical protein